MSKKKLLINKLSKNNIIKHKNKHNIITSKINKKYIL